MSEHITTYFTFASSNCPSIKLSNLESLKVSLSDISWDEPKTSLDLNNISVLLLIEAESTNSHEARILNLEMALEALQFSIEQENSHPLCAVHLALVYAFLGNTHTALDLAFSNILRCLQADFKEGNTTSLGLVYVPSDLSPIPSARQDILKACLTTSDGNSQALMLSSILISYLQLVFYNSSGLRFLTLANQLIPNTASLNLKLGLANIMANRWEGLIYLKRSYEIASPDFMAPLHALYLAYRSLGQQALAQFFWQQAKELSVSLPNSSQLKWSSLAFDSPFTYIPFDEDLVLTVESNLHSIVTSVLLAEGDWFEAEIELWRDRLKPGMTVIDVGANVGVYTFSAAQRVRSSGKVIAVEPFDGCVRCLEETCRLNHIDWVKVYEAAASDHPGKLRLSIQAASELNEVVSDDDETPLTGTVKEVSCITLDSLIEQENLDRIDWIKIDAEGHEMQVLNGCDRILSDFSPGILYENIAGSNSSNTPVANYLQQKGYQLYRYQSYTRQLIRVDSLQDIQGNLNIVALKANE